MSDGASPALAPSVELVPGLAPALAELGVRTRAYRVALDRDARTGVSYQDARSAADAGDRRLTELVSKVLSHYSCDEEANMKRRTELLEPYVVLMNDLRDRYRRRLPPGDIDSATGALVGGDVAASIAAESVAKTPVR